MKLLHPAWKDYELIDSGNFEKLERFGPYFLIRPEPQAIWQPAMPPTEWKTTAHAHFKRTQSDQTRLSGEVKGGWKKTRTMPESWHISYGLGERTLVLRLALTGFGHVGVFPEQAVNWDLIFQTMNQWSEPMPNILNLFAYTGAASVVAGLAGATVTHCDASRPGLTWANQNMQLNGLKDIRWVHEDAMKFVKREAKRGKKYHGVIMDPPPYGRGPQGEKWTLEEGLNDLVCLTAQILEPRKSFFILSTYASGLPSMVALNVVRTYFPKAEPEWGELFLKGKGMHHLPMGTFVRFSTTDE